MIVANASPFPSTDCMVRPELRVRGMIEGTVQIELTPQTGDAASKEPTRCMTPHVLLFSQIRRSRTGESICEADRRYRLSVVCNSAQVGKQVVPKIAVVPPNFVKTPKVPTFCLARVFCTAEKRKPAEPPTRPAVVPLAMASSGW